MTYKQTLDFEQLKNIPMYSKIIRNLESKIGRKPLPKPIQELLVFSEKNTHVKDNQAKQLIGCLNYDIKKPINSAPYDGYISFRFWIHLHIFLREYGTFYEKRNELFEPIFSSTLNDVKKVLLAYKKLLNLHKEIKSLFSDEEIEHIKYMRHCMCHLHQDEYSSPPKLDYDSLKKGDGIYLETVEKFLKKNKAIEEFYEKNSQSFSNSLSFEMELAQKYKRRLLASESFKKLTKISDNFV